MENVLKMLCLTEYVFVSFLKNVIIVNYTHSMPAKTTCF